MDRIFTRLGASDDIMRGMSTFHMASPSTPEGEREQGEREGEEEKTSMSTFCR